VKDAEAVAIVISALRQAHGEDIARALLTDGMSLAVLMDAVFSLSMRKRRGSNDRESARVSRFRRRPRRRLA